MEAGAVGVDGCRPGRIAAIDVGANVSFQRFPDDDPRDLFAAFSDAVIVIDVPIGLLELGARTADVEARLFVGSRRNSVFTAPVRPMLRADGWEEACRIRTAVEGKRCSRQVAAILPKILAVDRRMSPARQSQVREGHPEVSFAAMAGRRGLAHYKGTPQG